MMDFKTLGLVLAGGLSALLAIILGAISWSHSKHLSLPLPTSLPALSSLFPIILLISTAFIRVFGRNTAKGGGPPRWLDNVMRSLRVVDRIILLVSVIIATLATTYLPPSDVLTCRLETRWQNLYMNKNANAIRTIQSAMQCCGFRSIHDRAWPFKDADHDDRACERALGYTQSCLRGWRRQEQTCAWFVLVAALSSILLKFILAHYEPSSRVWYRTYDSDDGLNPRINEIDDSDSGGPNIDGYQRRRITEGSYTDNPEPREDPDGGVHQGNEHDDGGNWGDNNQGTGEFHNGPMVVPSFRG